MPCYKPLQGFRGRDSTKNGKHKIVFNRANALADGNLPGVEVTVPCGQCVGCRLERSRQWAIRCIHEASLYENNCFITLTFSDEHLPSDRSLDVAHFQKFMKRLRKKYGEGIRFFHCGEYGEEFGRPHYHAILFNFDFDDKYHHKDLPSGFPIYRSESLEQLWPFGYSSIGGVTFDSAAYVARYIMKKVTGDEADDHYQGRKPEYTTMSRRPGIAKVWFEKFYQDVFPSDNIHVNGKQMRPAKYYDNLYEHMYPGELEKIKQKRKRSAKEFSEHTTPERLRVREKKKLLDIQRLVRPIEDVF